MLQAALESEDFDQVHRYLLDIKRMRLKPSYCDKELERIFCTQKLPSVAKYEQQLQTTTAEELYSRTKHIPSFRINKTDKVLDYGDNVALSINAHLYKTIFNELNKSNLWIKYSIDNRLRDYHDIKAFSTYMLRDGGKTEPDWHLFVGIEMLYGWNYDVIKADCSEKIENWVQNDFHPTLNGSRSAYLTMFKAEVDKILHWRSGIDIPMPTVEEFSQQLPLHGTSGSAYDPGNQSVRAKVTTVSGIPVGLDNNKYSKSAALTPENKARRILGKQKGRARVTNKVEHYPKQRLIISADYNSTEKMRYIDTFLVPWMTGNPDSTLWLRKEQVLELWLNFSEVDGIWNVPIDQSAFDHHVDMEMIIIMLTSIKQLIQDVVHDGQAKQEAEQVMDSLVYMFENTDIDYENPEGKFKVYRFLSGILSGWQWTAFLDTLANIAESRVALRSLKDQGVSVSINNFNAQGDDQECKFRQLLDGLLYWSELTRSGFDIHPSKNFFSNRHDEYLRRYATKGGINGYPARMINRICWSYPGKSEPTKQVEKINTLIDRWEKLGHRLFASDSWIIKRIRIDLRGAKVDKTIAEILLFGDVVLGNRGFKNSVLNRKWAGWNVAQIPGTWKYHLEIDAPGYSKFAELYGQGQQREVKDWMLQVMNVSDRDKSGTELKTETDVFASNELGVIEPKQFTIAADDRISRPDFLPGWQNCDLFGINKEVMERAFGPLDVYLSIWNAPKSWVYDYLAGKTRVSLPRIKGMSSEMISMLSTRYENSMVRAMMRKRKIDQKWLRLNQYYVSTLPSLIQRVVDMRRFFYM